MRVAWLLSESIKSGLYDPEKLKQVASIWGSWKTWESYKTDNCVCNETQQIVDLLKKAFHAVCNFYIPVSVYTDLNKPQGVRLFDGKFQTKDIINKDDIVAMNLIVNDNDIILLIGFDLSVTDEYRANLYAVMKEYSDTQFVLIDYNHKLLKEFEELDNLTSDTLDSVMKLL